MIITHLPLFNYLQHKLLCMGTKILNLEVLIIYLLLLTPCPFTQVLKFLCSKDSSRLVRKIVRSKWTPIFDKYQVKLPLECPLHPTRDSYAPRQDAKKRDRPTQWTCRLCGKSFYQERFLDLHFDSRHKSIINKAEDAVCLADFCDIMRCEVFQTEQSTSLRIGEQLVSTDIEVWGDSFGQSSALAKANVAYLSLLPLRASSIGSAKVQNHHNRQEQIVQNAYPQTEYLNNKDSINHNIYHNNKGRHRFSPHYHSNIGDSTVDSTTNSAYNSKSSSSTTNTNKLLNNDSVHNKERNDTLNSSNNSAMAFGKGDNNKTANNGDEDDDDNGAPKVKANCKIDELSQLKMKCEFLVRSCIAGLILQMTDQTFQEMEEELNKAVCWYLTCERYWEDGPLEPRAFPWGLILILTFVLSTGICFCYYIIWILFDSSEETNGSNINQHQEYKDNIQSMSQPNEQSEVTGQAMVYPQEYYPYQDYHITGIHHGAINEGPQGDIQYPYQQESQQHQHQHPHLHQHQDTPLVTTHDMYPEPVLYDYHHSPRRYTGDQRLPGTPTIIMPIMGGAGQTPLRHQRATGLISQQDILGRHDYISRPIATTAVSDNDESIARTIAVSNVVNHPTASLYYDDMSRGPNATNKGKQYNTIPRPLEARQRYVSGSQQSLQISTSNNDIVQNEVGQNEHYIYVTYPPDLKKRFFD